MVKKVLIILTSADKIPKANNKQTGWYLPELAHPYYVLQKAGYQMDVLSPKGGKAPMDEGSVAASKDDEVSKQFLADKTAQALVNNTKTPAQVKASDYSAVFFPGGHGPMFDLATDATTAKLAADVYDNGGVVAAVCHGPAGLVPVKLSNGDALVKGKTVTCFTNEEEDITTLTPAMPFSLEDQLKELGAKFTRAANWQECVAVDTRLITGQNPASSHKLAECIVAELSK